MIKDRGKIKKWQGFYMTEHTDINKKIDWDKKKIERPILDENQLEEINQIICEGMEFNQDLMFTIYSSGAFRLLIGKVHYIDQLKNELRIIDKFEDIHHIRFVDIIKVLLGDNDEN